MSPLMLEEKTISEYREADKPASSRALQPIILSPIFWLETYDSIRSILSYSVSEDLYATRIAEAILFQKSLEKNIKPWILMDLNWEKICKMIEKRSVCVFGGSAELEEVMKSGEITSCDTIIAVDGAASLLHEYGEIPDILVSDLDGSWNTIINLSRENTYFIIHAHGDNIAALKLILASLPIERTVLTIQTITFANIGRIVGGFTDGDRAFSLSVACKASKIVLYGMNFDGRTGWWSKPWLSSSIEPWYEKKKKLNIAKQILLIIVKNAVTNKIDIFFGDNNEENNN